MKNESGHAFDYYIFSIFLDHAFFVLFYFGFRKTYLDKQTNTFYLF